MHQTRIKSTDIYPRYAQRRPCRAVLIALALLALGHGLNVAAQTEFQIPSSNTDLEQEYRTELSNWLLKAYEGEAEAQFKAGVLFASDQFNSADLEQAVYWYRQAARQGHALAQYNLGHHYLTGNGLPKSETDAMHWWQQAAEQDHALAQFNVGRAYYIGIGGQQDLDKSRYWLQRAAINKEPKSIEIIQELGWDADMPSTPAKPQSSPSLVQSEPSDIKKMPSQAALNSVALYTDPAIKNILITVLDGYGDLEVVKQGNGWLEVRKSNGFPVWVHTDFLKMSGDTGTVIADNVNTRSVPLVSPGTVVGQLRQDEAVQILSQQSSWARVQSPPRFTAWIKAEDYDSASKSKWSVSQ